MMQSLTEHGYYEMPYPADLRTAVLAMQQAWKAFCELPIHIKSQVPYGGGSPGVGYESQATSDQQFDPKENFDVTLGQLPWLQEQAEALNIPELDQLLEAAAIVAQKTKDLTIEFARNVEAHYGLNNFTSEVEKSADTYFIRMIHYPKGQPVGSEIASHHPDKSGFTLHLFEDREGLQRLNFEKTSWIDMPVSTESTVIFPAMQLQYRSNGALQATCHRVIATEQSSQQGRYSAVCFVQLADTPRYDKATNGRLQEKPAGFNYGLDAQAMEHLMKKKKK